MSSNVKRVLNILQRKKNCNTPASTSNRDTDRGGGGVRPKVEQSK